VTTPSVSDAARRTVLAPADPPARSVLLVLFAVLALHAAFAIVGADTDDALITYRYAERLGEGLGFTYNDGERVLGTTTPLWTLVLAGGAAIGIPPPLLADVLNPVLGALAGALLFVLVARAWSVGAASLAAILYATSPLFLRSASYGMETPLFCLLIVASLVLVGTSRFALAGLVVGLACVTRLEGVLLAGVIALAHVRRPRALIAFVVPAMLCVAPWIVFATAYFGSPLPHSLQAKLVHGYRPGVLDTAAFLLWQSPHRFVLAVGGALGAYALVGGALSRSASGRGGSGSRHDAPTERALRLGAAFALVYVVFYLVGHPVPYEWYLPPLQIVLAGLSGIAFSELAWLVASRVGATDRADRMAAIGLAAIGMSILVPRTFSQTQMWHGRVDASFMRLVSWVDTHAPADARIFAGDIGYLGYHTRRPIVDASALVSPGVLELRRAGGHPNAIIASERPEVLVFPVQPGVYPIAWPDSESEMSYRPVARFPADRPLEMTEAEARDWFRLRGGWEPDYVVYMRHDLM
jgi:hypothetical protein